MLVMDTCHRCGNAFEHDVPAFLIGTESELMIRKHAICDRCKPIAERESQEREDREAVEEERRKRLDDMRQRVEESNLNRYELAFDPGFPTANRGLIDRKSTRLNSSHIL